MREEAASSRIAPNDDACQNSVAREQSLRFALIFVDVVGWDFYRFFWGGEGANGVEERFWRRGFLRVGCKL